MGPRLTLANSAGMLFMSLGLTCSFAIYRLSKLNAQMLGVAISVQIPRVLAQLARLGPKQHSVMLFEGSWRVVLSMMALTHFRFR